MQVKEEASIMKRRQVNLVLSLEDEERFCRSDAPTRTTKQALCFMFTSCIWDL